MEPEDYLGRKGAPDEAPCRHIDASELPPPEPLTKTLETLGETDDETVLVQTNDRVPQHLFPKLDERGYEYVTHEEDDGAVTVIWKPR